MLKSERPMLMTVREVSILLHIHRPKVYDLIHEGTLEAVKIGADWRVKIHSVEKLVGPIPDEFFTKASNSKVTDAARKVA